MLSFLWTLSRKRKKKACLIIGSSCNEMNRTVLSKYGVHLAHPLYTEYAVEIAGVGVHYHFLKFVSKEKLQSIFEDCITLYPSKLYELDIVVVLTKQNFLSVNTKKLLSTTDVEVVFCYSGNDVLVRELTLSDVPEEYFSCD